MTFISPSQNVPSKNPQAFWRKPKLNTSPPKGAGMTDNRFARAWILRNLYND
jgi:hypothetical protein